MPTKVKEIESNPRGDRNACPVCNPRADRLREDEVWDKCPTNTPHPDHDEEMLADLGF